VESVQKGTFLRGSGDITQATRSLIKSSNSCGYFGQLLQFLTIKQGTLAKLESD
jgi:hypothetical protein